MTMLVQLLAIFAKKHTSVPTPSTTLTLTSAHLSTQQASTGHQRLKLVDAAHHKALAMIQIATAIAMAMATATKHR